MSNIKKYICHICGYDNLSEPAWGLDGKNPSFTICPSCGVEFGYEDCTDTSSIRYRDKWISNGCIWFEKKRKPDNWDIQSQLNNIGIAVNNTHERNCL